MASQDFGVQNTRWLIGLPEFSLTSLFAYFDDLLNVGRNSPPVAAPKKDLYKQASNKVNEVTQAFNQDSQIMQSALDFLYQIAVSEQTKERKVLERYRQELQDILPEDNNLAELLHKFTPELLENVDELTETYQEVVKYLTVLRTNLESYRNRLETFQEHSTKDMEELHHDDYRMRAKGELHALANSAVGAATEKQKDSDEVYASLLRKAVKEYITRNNIVDKIMDATDAVALLAAIALDIENYMDTELRNLKGTSDLRAFSVKEMRTVVKDKLMEFSDRSGRELTRLEQAMESNGSELQDILSAVKTTLGIQVNSSRAVYNSRKKNYESQKRRQDSVINGLMKTHLDPSIKDDLFRVTFKSTSSNTLHGDIFEALSAVLTEHLVKVKGSAAVDTLGLGELSVEMEQYLDTEELMEHIRNISDEFTDYAAEQRENRFDSLRGRYSDMNRAVKDSTDKINRTLRELDKHGIKTEDIFIYHESLKLYKTMESNEAGGSNKFHGRDLEILAYIDELYSMAGFQALELPQREALEFLAVNIAQGTVGASSKNALGNYLGMFAGLLMFGDVQNIANEAVNKINENQSNSAAYNIHLYNLNGFYVPASMILFYTYDAMQKVNKQLQSNYGAKVQISTSDANKVVSDWLAQRDEHLAMNEPYHYSANDWARVGEGVAKGTKVRIAFFAAFAEFINSLP